MFVWRPFSGIVFDVTLDLGWGSWARVPLTKRCSSLERSSTHAKEGGWCLVRLCPYDRLWSHYPSSDSSHHQGSFTTHFLGSSLCFLILRFNMFCDRRCCSPFGSILCGYQYVLSIHVLKRYLSCCSHLVRWRILERLWCSRAPFFISNE